MAPTGDSRRGAVAEAERVVDGPGAVVDGAVVVFAPTRQEGSRRVRSRSRPDAARALRIPDPASRLVHPTSVQEMVCGNRGHADKVPPTHGDERQWRREYIEGAE